MNYLKCAPREFKVINFETNGSASFSKMSAWIKEFESAAKKAVKFLQSKPRSLTKVCPSPSGEVAAASRTFVNSLSNFDLFLLLEEVDIFWNSLIKVAITLSMFNS